LCGRYFAIQKVKSGSIDTHFNVLKNNWRKIISGLAAKINVRETILPREDETFVEAVLFHGAQRAKKLRQTTCRDATRRVSGE